MLEDSVIPCMIEQAGPAHAKPFRPRDQVFGLGESKAADLLADLYPLPEGLEIGYRAALPEIHIRLQTNINDARSEQIGSTYTQHVQDRLAPYIFGYDEDDFCGTARPTLSTTKQNARSCRVLYRRLDRPTDHGFGGFV